jgi:hypothetical protein
MKAREIKKAIDQMNENQLVELNNMYCQEFGYNDNEVYSNDEDFFNTFFEGKPMEVARSTFYGDYDFSHYYVMFTGYGNLKTFHTMDIEKLVDSVEVMAENIADRFEDFENIF